MIFAPIVSFLLIGIEKTSIIINDINVPTRKHEKLKTHGSLMKRVLIVASMADIPATVIAEANARA